jgi:hypothetical protein
MYSFFLSFGPPFCQMVSRIVFRCFFSRGPGLLLHVDSYTRPLLSDLTLGRAKLPSKASSAATSYSSLCLDLNGMVARGTIASRG